MKKIILIISLVLIFILSGVVMYVLVFNKESSAPPTTLKQEFSNGQPYAVYKENGFTMFYPAWTRLNFDTTAPEADKIKVAVSNIQGCTFFLKIKDLPEDQTLQAYTDQVIKNMGDRLSVSSNEVKEQEAFLDGEVKTEGDVTMRNISHVYKKGKTIYSLAFVAEKNAFANACQPVVDEVVKSVKLQ
jgi:hypothetical protein